MKRRKLKGFVLPTLYLLIIGALFASISMLGSTLSNVSDYSDNDLSVSTIKEHEVKQVIKEEQKQIVKPYNSEKVSVAKSYYDMKDDEQKQVDSLIYYENTYLQNSGVLYSSDEAFDVLSAYDGTVSRVDTDDILGNVVEITHNTNLKTVYYSLGEVSVKESDNVVAGQVIGKSGDNGIEQASDNSLLFEVYYNGKTIDPEDFYNMDIKDLQ